MFCGYFLRVTRTIIVEFLELKYVLNPINIIHFIRLFRWPFVIVLIVLHMVSMAAYNILFMFYVKAFTGVYD